MKSSYFGITGFVSSEEMQKFLRALELKSNGKSIRQFVQELNRKIMIGILVSKRSLDGRGASNPWRYPDPQIIKDIFVDDPLFLNTIHYTSDDWQDLPEQLEKLVRLSPAINAIQLNMAWPDPDYIKIFKSRFPQIAIILQVGSRAYYEVGNSPTGIYTRLESYQDYIDFALIDMSGGNGQLISVNDALIKVVSDIYDRFSGKFLPAVAGGLNKNSVIELLPLIKSFEKMNKPPNSISIDAEGQLRDGNDTLVLPEAIKYLIASYATFS